MKLKSIFGGAALALAFIASAHADVTVTITGASAFRSATLASIKARYLAATVKSFQFAHDQATGSLTGSTRAIFKGNFPGVAGTTTIKCCFTGSVEGIRALVPVTDPLPPTYLQDSDLVTAASAVGGETSAVTSLGLTESSDIAFSDVKASSTPFGAYALQPAAPSAGVIVFTMIGSEGCPITNISAQQFRALLSKGFQPLRLFTGVAADTQKVFVTGRNDGSGTRTTYLAETGFGITSTVKQYVANQSTGTTLSTIQLVPAGGVNVPALPGQNVKNKSTVWGQDVDGNGGYDSGSTLKSDLGKTGTSVTVLDEFGDDAFGTPQNLFLVTWLSLSDCVAARDAGAVVLGYNGVRLTDFAVASSGSILSAADKAKITEGAYTAWGYENMYRKNDITTGDKVTVYDAIKNNLVLGTAGIALTDMHIGREVDGGVVAP
ncbi:MAG: hypothetical protein ACOYM3_04945 [Terrimicrobiaceae bacterium]